jgi:ferredoxin
MAKVIREIIRIDEDLCDGCGDCIGSCAEGALEIVDGKARLKKEKFCDGAGACLGHCPTGALTIERREVEEFDEAAVEENLRASKQPTPEVQWASQPSIPTGGCPGSQGRQFKPAMAAIATATIPRGTTGSAPSALAQWPVQLTLVSPNAPYFANADLLIAADCVPFAYNGFHKDFLAGKALVVGCPKLDNLQAYVEKLTMIFQANDLNSAEVLLMEVPCCGGIAQAARVARDQAGANFPLKVTTIGLQGEVLGSQSL